MDLEDYFCRITTDTYLSDIMYQEYFYLKHYDYLVSMIDYE